MAKTGASEEVQVAIGGDASSLREATDTATEALGNVRHVAGLAGAALGALAVGGLAKATSAAAAFESQMVEVEKVTDPETARQMGDAIQEMASRMPVAQKELANITAQAGRFGIEGSENIENFTETVAKMSVATDLSTQQAGESFARLSTLMDVPIERVGDMGNVINELSNTMATSSSEIVDSALRSSGTLSQMGASSEDIFSLNAAMNEASESAERAGTRLRRMAQEVQDPAKVKDLASALGMNVEEFEQMRSEDPTALFRRMAQTMGEGGEASDALRSSLSTTSQQALTALSQNMEGLASAQETANQQMKDGTSLQEEYEAASSTFNSQLQVTKNRLRNVAIQIGENVLPVASEFLGYVNSAISAFSEWNESSGGMVGTIALVAGALGGFAVAAASAVSALGGMSAVLGAIGGALTILTGPVGIAIAAIALLAGAWKVNLFGIRDVTSNVVWQVEEILGDFFENISEWWEEHGEEITETVTGAYEAVAGAIEKYLSFIWKNLFQPILESIEKLWSRHGDALLSEAQKTFDAVVGYIETVVTFLWRNVTQPILSKLQTAWDMWGDEILTIVNAVFGAIELVVSQGMDMLLSGIRVVLALIRGDWETAWDLYVDYLKRTWDRITSFLTGPGKDGFVAALTIVVDAVKIAFNYLIGTGEGTLHGDVTGVFRTIARWIRSTGKSLFSGAFGVVVDGAKAGFSYLIGTGEGTLIGDVKSTLTGISDWVGTTAKKTVKKAFEKVASAIKEAFEIEVDWPEPPTIVKKAYNGTLGSDIDWPSRPGGDGGGGGGGPIFGGGPLLDTGGFVESTGRAIVHEGEEVVPEAEVDRDRGDRSGSAAKDSVEKDVERALERTDRTDDITRKLDGVIRAIEESLDISIEIDDSGRYDTF
ncbi:phage tail tape measure protein [Natrinema sp. DC36]|uniref:phage tail tape measure protein n=1 Tax=Natrinema sp. DC36 TaxID=2878680 RepID=UPI001CF05303|nr:phage tail tape measure protein [Natrinema sp. DC36]